MPPNTKTIAQTFRDNGYQAFAVGKLHVMPQRDRIGFDDAHISEEGRPYYGSIDDDTYNKEIIEIEGLENIPSHKEIEVIADNILFITQ